MSRRELRIAPDIGVFNARAIPTAKESSLPAGPWWKLGRKGYSSEFYANPGSRLTPSSYEFPCVYLGTDHKTTVSEIFGDRFADAHSKERRYVAISVDDANTYAYRRVDGLPTRLTLCDFNDPDTLAAVGIDAATLYTTHFEITQAWAECIARHPIQFDGIMYLSRHTFQKCVVLWKGPEAVHDVELEMSFLDDGEFIYSKPAYEVAALHGLKLAFIS